MKVIDMQANRHFFLLPGASASVPSLLREHGEEGGDELVVVVHAPAVVHAVAVALLVLVAKGHLARVDLLQGDDPLTGSLKMLIFRPFETL